MSEATPRATSNKAPHPDDFLDDELESYAVSELHFSQADWRGMDRKVWEWAMVLRAIDRHGYLRRDAVALGIASGFEPIVFALTNHLRFVIASDLYGQTEFAALEADTRMLHDPASYWSHGFERDRLLVQNADAISLPFGDESFDVVFSCSSIEHFGSSDRIRKSMREAQRVLKPGGMYALTVDYLFSSPHADRARDRRNRHIRQFLSREDIENLIIDTPGLALREPTDFSVAQQLVGNPYDLERGASESGEYYPRLWMHWRDHYLTSFFVALFKE